MKKHNTFIEWTMIATMACILFICTPFARALEFQFDKNAAANISAPIINSTTNNTFATGANNTAFYVHGANSSAAMGAFGAAASNCTIIGTSGIYNFPLNASEMNYDRVGILYNGTGCLAQYLLINTVPKEYIDNVQTSLGNGTVVSGNLTAIAANVITAASIAADAIGASEIAADAIGASEIATDAIGAAEITDGAITSTEIADDAIDAGAIATSAIGAAEIAASAITSSEFAQTAADLVWGTTTRTITGGNLTNPQTFNLTGNVTGNLIGNVTGTANLNGTITG